MSEQKKDFPDFYITAPQPCPYLPDKFERKLFTHLNRDKPRGIVDHLLTNGFRRSQNIAYTPYCEGCSACTSVRVIVDRFEPGRGFERILERNGDIVARERAAVPTAEQYRLFRAYVLARHSDGGMAEMSMLDYFMMVQDSIIDTFLTEYRIRPGGALAHEFDWPQCPRPVQVVLEFVFVCESIDALKSRVFSAGRDGYERVRLSVVPPKFTEGPVGVSPQHF